MDITQLILGSEPVTVTEVKSWLKIDFTTDDDIISDLIKGCREMAEEITGRSFIKKQIEILYQTGDYEQEVELPFPDHDSVTALTINGTDYLSDTYVTGTKEKVLTLPIVFDSISDDNQGLYVKYTTTGNCPQGVKIAILKNIGELYEKRGNTFEGAIAMLTENTYSILAKYMKL